METATESFVERVGPVIVDLAQAASSSASLAQRRSEFTGRPGCYRSAAYALSWMPLKLSQRVRRCLRVRPASSLGKSLFGALQTVRWRKCMTVQRKAPPLQRGHSAARKACQRAGQCICDEAGKKLVLLNKNISKHVKRHFGRGTAARLLLGRAEIVYMFVGLSEEQYNGGDSHNDYIVHIFNVSDHCYIPWGSSFHRTSSDVKITDIKGRSMGNFAAAFELEWLLQYRMLSELDLRFAWVFAIYQASFCDRMVGNSLPNRLELKLLYGAEEFVEVWNPFRTPPAPRRRWAAGHAAWATMLHNIADEAQSESEDQASEAYAPETESSVDEADLSILSAGSDLEAYQSDLENDLDLNDGFDEAKRSSSAESLAELVDHVVEDSGSGVDGRRAGQPPAEGSPPAEPIPNGGGPLQADAPHVPPLAARAHGGGGDRGKPAEVCLVLPAFQSSSLVFYDAGIFYAYCKMHRDRRLNRISYRGRKAHSGRSLGGLF